MSPFFRTSASFLALALGAGCATVAKKDIVWPDPPEKARVKYVMTIKGPDDLDPSSGAAFLRTLRGASAGPFVERPMGAAISADGERLYIADFGGGALLRADFKRKVLEPFAESEPVRLPSGVALDADENLYVTDSAAQQVLVFDKTGARLRSFGAKEGIERPTGIAVDPARKLVYVSDTASKSRKFRVLVYGLDGKYLRDVGGGTGKEDGQLSFQTYLALDKDGNLYVADTMNFRIQVFSPDGTFVRKLEKLGDTPGTFARLKGLALDGFGNLYAVDSSHEAVQIFNHDFELLMYFGGHAQKLEWMNLPSCIAIDPTRNRIYVCQESYGRVNVYELINTTATDSHPPPPPPSGG